jgi:hypothetical protein
MPEDRSGCEQFPRKLIEHRQHGASRSAIPDAVQSILDEANANGWTVVDMKKDWKRIFPWEK